MNQQKISIKDHKHIIMDSDFLYCEAKEKSDELCAVILCRDKEGNKYILDFTKNEIKQFFKGWQEAKVKYDFNKGE